MVVDANYLSNETEMKLDKNLHVLCFFLHSLTKSTYQVQITLTNRLQLLKLIEKKRKNAQTSKWRFFKTNKLIFSEYRVHLSLADGYYTYMDSFKFRSENSTERKEDFKRQQERVAEEYWKCYTAPTGDKLVLVPKRAIKGMHLKIKNKSGFSVETVPWART